MLQLVQNIGFKRSENSDDTKMILESALKSRVCDYPRSCPVPLCSDNVKAVQQMAKRVFGYAVMVKQDLFRIIQHITDKVKVASVRKVTSMALLQFLYAVDRQLRPPNVAATAFEEALARLFPAIDTNMAQINCTRWEGCIASSAAYIRRGDAYVAYNVYQKSSRQISWRACTPKHKKRMHLGTYHTR